MEGTIEEKAKAMGHVPKEEWKGDPEKWRPAEEFVERGENIIPILKKRLDETNQKLDNMGKDLKITIAANAREVEEAKKAEFNRATKEYNDKLAALDAKEIEAFSEHDSDKLTEVKKERSKLKEPVKPVAPVDNKATPQNVEFEDWSKKETWYQKDDPNDMLTQEADVQAVALRKRYPDKPLSDIFKLATKNVKKLHPDKFENPRRKEPGAVEEGGGNTPKNGNATFASLPASAKESYKRIAAQFKAKGRDYKKEDYAKDWHDQ